MYIEDFNYHTPKSIKGVCELLGRLDNAALIAGGTDLIVEIKKGLRRQSNIISLKEIDELKTLKVNNGNLEIGAGVTHNMIALSPIIKKDFTAVAEAASKIGTEQIRNTGTVGGNLCTGASCCDMAPILMALDASVEITSTENVKTLSLKDFFIFHKETSLGKGEILTKIIVPSISNNVGVCFEKFGLKESASISVASAAVMVKIENEHCTDASVVIGAVAPTPVLCERTNKTIIGKKIEELTRDSNVMKQAVELASEDSSPIDDIRGSADYRRSLVKVLVQRAILKAVGRARNGD